MQIYGAHVQVLVFRLFSASVDLTCDAPHNQRNGNEKSSRIAGETARGTPMFRFSKPETPRAALFVFLRNETRAKSGFVSYVSIFLCFDFDPSRDLHRLQRRARRSATINVVDFNDVTTCQNIRKVSEHMYPDKNVM